MKHQNTIEDQLPCPTEVEFIPEEVFGFTNEYLVTFFAQGKLFERNFEFPPFSISEKNTVFIDLMGQDCVIAE